MNPIKQIAEEKGISRAELGRQAGIPYATMNSISAGNVREMRFSTAKKLADYAGWQPGQVLEGYSEWRDSLSRK